MVTLHHFTHPQWFEEEGGFTEAENINMFVEYCKLMFKEFGNKIEFWATFNEASVILKINFSLNNDLYFKVCGILWLYHGHMATGKDSTVQDSRECCIEYLEITYGCI